MGNTQQQPSERSNTYPALPYFDPDLIPAIGGRYVTQEHSLAFIYSNGTSNSQLVSITYRVLLGDGRVVQGQDVKLLATGIAPLQLSVPLPKGYLLGAVISLTQGGILHGEVYGTLCILYNVGASQVISEVLAQGYLDTASALSFPEGKNEQAGDGMGIVRDLGAQNPGAGNNIALALQGTGQGIINGLKLTLVTSATVANRQVIVALPGPGANDTIECTAPAVQAASTTFVYEFFVGAAAINAGTTMSAPLPNALGPLSPRQLQTVVQNLQAGDALTLQGGTYTQWTLK